MTDMCEHQAVDRIRELYLNIQARRIQKRYRKWIQERKRRHDAGQIRAKLILEAAEEVWVKYGIDTDASPTLITVTHSPDRRIERDEKSINACSTEKDVRSLYEYG
jgi:hypothetical protein